MAAKNPKPLLMNSIRGRDGSTPKFNIPDERCEEALNVDWFESALGRKRNGAAAISLTGGTGQTGVVSALLEHVPSSNQSGRELWAVDDAATPAWKRLAGGTAWADVSVSDACQSEPWNINAVSFNGKLHVAYNSSVNRLHVWDGVAFRRSGLDTAGVPTVANQGTGTYAATIRYYKVRWVVIVSSVVTRAGELSPAVSFTPDASHLSARVTAPAVINEGETHWEIYASPDGANYFRQSQVVVATTTYDDTTAPTAYSGNIPPDANATIAPLSAKYLAADLKRLVMTGVWETSAGNSMTPKANRVWWTAPLGATDNGDDERISNTSDIKNYDDVDEDTTGIGGPVNGSIFVFSYGGVWKFITTTVPSAPYAPIRIVGAQGCIDHKSIIKAEDENGETCLYWLSPVGPVRFGSGGYQRCHEDIDDIWRTVNLSATTRVAHGVFHRDKHQIWWWVATGASNEPDTRIIFDTRLGRVVDSGVDNSVRHGWAKHTGGSCSARCSALMSDSLGATMSRTLKPHIGLSTGTAIWKCDTGTTDGGVAFQSYVKSKAYVPWGLGAYGSMPEEMILACQAVTGVTIQLSIIKDFDASNPLVSTLLITPDGSETRIVKQFDNSRFAQAKVVQLIVGDAAAVDASWNLDAMLGDVVIDGDV